VAYLYSFAILPCLFWYLIVMTHRLENKTALITGAGQGIGLSAVRLFASEGANVIATDRNPEQLAQAAKVPGVNTAVLDVTDVQHIQAAAEKFPQVNILFNCAGIVHDGGILDCDVEEWEEAFSVNTTSMFLLIKAFLPDMIASGGGSIINMSSVASSITGVPNRLAYSASKAAVIGLTKAVAADHVADGIRCNAICPGTVDTPSLKERIEGAADPAAARKNFLARQPMGRLGSADEIAVLALYLASDESAFTTGTTHVIDGGWSN